MGVPKRRTSKMKKRQRKASLRKKAIQVPVDSNGKAYLPHRVCPETGMYKGKQIISVSS